jgi:hypothetical protein
MQAARFANILEFKACCIGRGKTSVAVFRSETALTAVKSEWYLQIMGVGSSGEP